MIIKIQPRQSGKTYDIAQRMKAFKSSAVIVASLASKAYFCRTYPISEKRVFAMSEAVKGATEGFKEVYVDEIGCCMQMIIPNIKYMTHT